MKTLKIICLSLTLFSHKYLNAQKTYWEQVNNGPQGSSIDAFCNTQSGKLLAGTSHGGIYGSTDGGILWRQVNTQLSSTRVWSFLCSGEIIFAGSEEGVYVSSDDGIGWVLSSPDVYPYSAEFLSSNPVGEVFVGTTGRGVFHSSDNGNTWSQTRWC